MATRILSTRMEAITRVLTTSWTRLVIKLRFRSSSNLCWKLAYSQRSTFQLL